MRRFPEKNPDRAVRIMYGLIIWETGIALIYASPQNIMTRGFIRSIIPKVIGKAKHINESIVFFISLFMLSWSLFAM